MSQFETITIQDLQGLLSLRLDPCEYDERLPSFRCLVTCKVSHPTGHFIYEASNIWFGTNEFDRFLAELSDITQGKLEQARFNDLSEHFVFDIIQHSRNTEISLCIFEPWHDNVEAQLSFKSNVEFDFPAVLLASLREIVRWW